MSAKKQGDHLKIQAQIRQNADEVSNMLQNIGKWEKSMKSKDETMRKKSAGMDGAPGVRGVRSGAGTVQTKSSNSFVPPIPNVVDHSDGKETEGKSGSAAKHTYDVGYKKWENFDVDAALKDEEGGGAAAGDDIGEFNYDDVSADPVTEVIQDQQKPLTPASLAMFAGAAGVQVGAVEQQRGAQVPKARGVYHDKDAETAEREQGNKEFAAGQFPQAVKSYTKCLGLKKGNYIAFSNRAMAYLKMKEYIRAEVDCNSALTIDPFHVKSLVRRATARNALGKHRAALSDIYAAMELTEASSGNVKQHRVDLARTQEMLKQCVNRAPMVAVNVGWCGEGGEDSSMAGPDLPMA